MTVFILKLIAMGSMLVDHTAYWLVDNNNVMRNIGRLAFITYAFLIAESYYHLRERPERLKRHACKLFVLCLVSEPLYDQFTRRKWINWELQNVLPTLLFGFIALIIIGWWHNKNTNIVYRYIGSVIICFVAAITSYAVRSEYEFGGVILIVLFYLYLKKAEGFTLPQRIVCLLLIDAAYICTYIWASAGFGSWTAITEAAASFNRRLIGALVAFIPLAFYNRKLGYHSKWFSWLYSIFYPLQFIVLLVARYFLRGF